MVNNVFNLQYKQTIKYIILTITKRSGIKLIYEIDHQTSSFDKRL